MAGDTSGVLQLATNGSTTAVTVDTSQNVGIGTASPGAKLEVSFAAATGASNGVRINNTSTGHTYVRLINSATSPNDNNWNIECGRGDTRNFAIRDNSVGERMRIDTSGNVGIGTTSPLARLSVSGGITATGQFSPYNGATVLGYIGNDNSISGGTGTNLGIRSDTATTFSTGGATERMRIDSAGALILAGSTAQKASGTTWSNPSDQRLKDNIRDYTKGTTELMQVRVREWEYNGKGNTTEGLKGLGVVADEVMTVLPNTVETYDAKLNADDKETTAIKKFDATEITWLLVKTVQEQQTIINDLTARITALEGAA
jgi:hypothetical protein